MHSGPATLRPLRKLVYDRRVTAPPRFHVIDGTPAPDSPKVHSRSRIKAMGRPAEMIQCPRCGGREFVQTVTGALLRNGRPTGGTKATICVLCLSKGERITVP